MATDSDENATDPADQEVSESTSDAQASHGDDFDRVGTEISIMLRHAQESASKIRGDAEVEAQALVAQVRADLEADRVAHDQAATELIARTEETANTIRVDAEKFSTDTRSEAERHAETRKKEVEAELAQVVTDTQEAHKSAAAAAETAAAKADEVAASAQVRSNEIIAQAEVDAQNRGAEIVAQAEAAAQAKSDAVVSKAREALQLLISAETRSREELEKTRTSIGSVLEQAKITQLKD